MSAFGSIADIAAQGRYARPTAQTSLQRGFADLRVAQHLSCVRTSLADSMYNIEPLERDLDTTVITWMNVMIWSSMKRGKVAGPIHGFGKLLASL